MSNLVLGEQPLRRSDLFRLRDDARVGLALSASARAAVEASRQHVEQAMAAGRVCYGINTGFGKLARVRVPDEKLEALQVNLVRSHAAGVGPPLAPRVSRLAFALRIANMARGLSGVRPELVDHAMAVFNAGIVPVLPCQGSVGASGDLAPLAHMALVLIGEGEAWLEGQRLPGREALSRAGLAPICLLSKEGLALLNGTQVSTALLVDALLGAQELGRVADVACALSLEAYKGTAVAYDARIHDARGQLGQRLVAANLRRLLEGSAILASHQDCERVQDNYSMRCAPQVHGASRDVFDHVERIALIEANAVTDNPLVFENGDILSGGNFHAQPVALSADMLKVAVAELGSISERRIETLVNPDLSGLPAFLARDGGVDSGLMIAQVTAAALVSENKVLCHPAAVDSIPTSAGKEDHVSMATHGARLAQQVVENVTHVLGIELMAGFHALAFETRLTAGAGVEAARAVLARVLDPLLGDRVLAGDMAAVAGLIRDGSLTAAVEGVVGAFD